MKTKRKRKKVLNFTKASDKLLFDIFRSIQDIKKDFPSLKIKIVKE